MTNYFTSDSHFGHENVIRYCNRPFANADEMDEAMIERWNAIVKPNDTVYHLGDFAMGKNAAPNILRRLNGTKHLIWGNHDSNQTRKLDLWASSQYALEIKEADKLIVLCHYSMRVWNKSHYGSLMLYGHSHGSMEGNDQSLDVGVDCWNFEPITLEQILERMATLPPWKNVDHHKKDEYA
jgi:calcineurin-like phosphoesterase family protein